jgi:hypothetical protein
LQPAVPAAGALRPPAAAAQGCERPGAGGAVRPFPDSADELIEEIAERIAREAAAMPRICPWCVVTLANGAAFCSPTCQEDYHRKLMPIPFARSMVGSIIPDMRLCG